MKNSTRGVQIERDSLLGGMKKKLTDVPPDDRFIVTDESFRRTSTHRACNIISLSLTFVKMKIYSATVFY